MSPKDIDALALWDAKARTLIDRIDEVIDDETRVPATTTPLDALVHRVIARTPPPPGEILDLSPTDLGPTYMGPTDLGPAYMGPTDVGPTNMGPQPDRIDQWDAYVCRFDGSDDTGEPDRLTP